MNYKIFMCQESQSFKIYDIIWCWKHAADIETCHYIKDFTCIFVNSPASQNTNLFKVELWPGFTWKKKKNHYLSHGWLGVKKFEWTQYRLYCPCTNLSLLLSPTASTQLRRRQSKMLLCHRWSFLRMFRSWLKLPSLSCGEVFLFLVS